MFAQRKSSKNLVERGRLSVLWPTRKPSSCRPESLEPLHVEDRHCTTVVRATLESSQRDVITLCARRSTDDSANSVVQTSQHPCTPSPHQTLPHPSTATFFLHLHENACATVRGVERGLQVTIVHRQCSSVDSNPSSRFQLLPWPLCCSPCQNQLALCSFTLTASHCTLLVRTSVFTAQHCTGDQGPRTFASRHSTPHPVTLLSHRVEATAW